MRADLGVMISASHNPYDDNGIKLFGPDGYKLSDEFELKIETIMDGDLGKRLAKSANLGRAKRIDGVQDRYIEFAKRTLPRNLSLEGLRVVIDCAHGAAYQVAPDALWELGAEVIKFGVEPDGFNINKDCGSTEPAALAAKVREMRADIGIALDGDADRVVIVDEKGHVIDGDQLLAVVAESWRDDRRLAKRELEGRRPAVAARHRRDRDVQSRARAPSRRHRPLARPHGRRRPIRARAHARARLQRWRRAIRPPHPVGLCHHRRWSRHRAPGARGRQEAGPASLAGVPSVRPAAANHEERALPRRQAAREHPGADRDCCRAEAAQWAGPTRHPTVRNRVCHPCDGRG